MNEKRIGSYSHAAKRSAKGACSTRSLSSSNDMRWDGFHIDVVRFSGNIRDFS